MILLYIFYDFIIALFILFEGIDILKKVFPLKKFLTGKFDISLVLKKIEHRILILWIVSISTIFLSMIPFENFNNSFLIKLSQEQRMHVYLIFTFTILNILSYSLYKIIQYENFKEKLDFKDTNFKEIKVENAKLIETALNLKNVLKIKNSYIYMKEDFKLKAIKNIFSILFSAVCLVLALFLGIGILNIANWEILDSNKINGLQFVFYSFFLIISLVIVIIGALFSNSCINLEKRTVEKRIFGIKVKSILINNGEIRGRALYYQNIYVGYYVYFYNNYLGEIPLIISKDNEKIIKILNFLKLLTNQEYRLITK